MEFDEKSNKHGLVLTATGYTYDITGVGIDTDYINKKASPKYKGLIIYVGKDCDAFSKRYGKGGWEWANGGFIVSLQNAYFAFGRQEVWMEHVPDINMTKCEMP